jgi:hypothetical protein
VEKVITVQYRWTAEDYEQAVYYNLHQLFGPLTRFALHVFFAMLLLAGIAGLLTYPNPDSTSLAVQIGLILAGIYWFVIRRYDVRWTLRRRYAKRPDKDLDVQWEIGPDRISTECKLSRAEYTWEAILKVIRSPSGLMLYIPGPVGYYLPRRGFASDADFEQVAELAASKGRRVCYVA